MKKTWNLFSKTMRVSGLSVLFCILQASTLFGQAQKTVSGTITDDTDTPLIGVSIIVKGSGTGTISDIDGRYSVNVSGNNAIIQYSFVGYISQTVTVGNQSLINIVMKEDLQNLEEVVVIGYGVQKKSHLTGAVTKLRTDGLEDIPVSNVIQALQGRVSGVQVQNTTSEVGSTPQIRVRGLGSIGANSSPLIVVDGFPVADGLDALDINDIESLEVLKDAASAAIYGSRGANGVILVSTKNGDFKKPKYTAKASYGVKDAYKLHPVMSFPEYFDMVFEQAPIMGAKVTDNEMAMYSIGGDTDWQKAALRTANIFNAQLSISGGAKEVKYYISGSFTADEGIMRQNEYEKMNFRAKIEAKLSKKATFGVNISPTYQKKQKPAPNFINFYRYQTWMPVFHNAHTIGIVNPTGLPTGPQIGDYANPTDFYSKEYSYTYPARTYLDTNNVPIQVPGLTWVSANGNINYPDGVYVTPSGRVVYPSGTLTENPDGSVTRKYTTTPWSSTDNSPRQWMDNETRFQYDYRLQTSTFLNIEFSPAWTFRTSNSFYAAYSQSEWYKNREAQKANETNVSTYSNKLLVDLLSENTLNFTKLIDRKHDIDALIGFTAQKTTPKTAQIVGTDFPTDYIHTINAAGNIMAPYIDDRARQMGTYTYITEETLLSVLGRVNYGYADKYLASLTFRADASSKFGPDDKWGYFPSVSAGWRASEENFLKKYDWLSQLKLRGSWGLTGNKSIPDYVYVSKYESVKYPFGAGTGTVVSGIGNTEKYIPNRKISWEQTGEFDFGIDVSVLNSRVNFTADYYNSESIKLLLEEPSMTITGYSYKYSNIGKVRNTGYEFELSVYPVKTKTFEWNLIGNLSFNKNKLIALNSGDKEIISNGERDILWIARVGEPAIQYYGWKRIGVWDTVEEISENPHRTGDVPGGLRLLNTNPNPRLDAAGVAIIDEYDYIPLGSPFPDFIWSVTNNFRYKDFDLSFLIQGSQGGLICNGDAYYQEIRKYDKNYVKDRWLSPEHRGDGMTPYFNRGVNVWTTDYILEDASYAVLRNLTLGYTFNPKLCRSLGIASLRVFGAGENLLWWMPAGYRGVNPEARYTSSDWASPLIEGYQRGGFPSQRTISFGINLIF